MDRDFSLSSIIAEPFIVVLIFLLVSVVIAGSAVSAAFDTLTGNSSL
jgi:hypothetical protein